MIMQRETKRVRLKELLALNEQGRDCPTSCPCLPNLQASQQSVKQGINIYVQLVVWPIDRLIDW